MIFYICFFQMLTVILYESPVMLELWVFSRELAAALCSSYKVLAWDKYHGLVKNKIFYKKTKAWSYVICILNINAS